MSGEGGEVPTLRNTNEREAYPPWQNSTAQVGGKHRGLTTVGRGGIRLYPEKRGRQGKERPGSTPKIVLRSGPEQ